MLQSQLWLDWLQYAICNSPPNPQLNSTSIYGRIFKHLNVGIYFMQLNTKGEFMRRRFLWEGVNPKSRTFVIGHDHRARTTQ